MIACIEITGVDDGWRQQAEQLLEAVWPPEVVATLPWKGVVWAHPNRCVLVFDNAGGLIGHVEIFLRDATLNGRTVKLGGVGAVAVREDCRRQRGAGDAGSP